MIDVVGWLATVVFVGSYFLEPAGLRRMQMLGAVLWATYGVLLGATPVIVTNVLVLFAAAWTARRASAAAAAAAMKST